MGDASGRDYTPYLEGLRPYNEGGQSDVQPVVRDALLPCPFCCGKAYVVRHGNNRMSHLVACEDCGASLESPDNGSALPESWAWNRRAREGELLDALKAAATEWVKWPQKTSFAKMEDAYQTMRRAIRKAEAR